MKILIIATVRSGGYNLGEWISREMEYHYSHEPDKSYRCGDNEVVKHLINNVIEHHSDKEYDEIDTQSYDKVITLHRKDIRKASESMSYAKGKDSFQSRYSINDEWIRRNEEDIKKKEVFIGRCVKDISKITYSGLNLTYEGIYESGEEIELVKEYLGISNPKYQWMLDKKYKLRREMI